MPSAAISCCLSRCRGACGPAAASPSPARRSGSARRSTAPRASSRSSPRPAPPAHGVRHRGAHRVRARTASPSSRTTTSSIARPPSPARSSASPRPPQADATWSKKIMADPVLLFRFSALTFNGHRIHYDQPYVTGTEGYPGLIVHGPLMGMVQIELARRANPDKIPTELRVPRAGASLCRSHFFSPRAPGSRWGHRHLDCRSQRRSGAAGESDIPMTKHVHHAGSGCMAALSCRSFSAWASRRRRGDAPRSRLRPAPASTYEAMLMNCIDRASTFTWAYMASSGWQNLYSQFTIAGGPPPSPRYSRLGAWGQSISRRAPVSAWLASAIATAAPLSWPMAIRSRPSRPSRPPS